MKFISLASSSRGNAAFISYNDTNILVDCGISRKRIIEGLSHFGKTIDDVDCILISHSHSDHISGLPMVLKYNDIKVLSQRDTLEEIVRYIKQNNISPNLNNFKIVRPVNVQNEETYLKIKDINVFPLKGCHDVSSLYYKFQLGDVKIAILTDMGAFNQNVLRSLEDVNYLMLECNYDNNLLLENEKYSAALKNRISGSGGHLSNVDCCNIIMEIANKNLKQVYLSHISDENNSEDYAYEFVNKYLKDNYHGTNDLPEIKVSKRLEITEIINN